jgi:hypothetical protein
MSTNETAALGWYPNAARDKRPEPATILDHPARLKSTPELWADDPAMQRVIGFDVGAAVAAGVAAQARLTPEERERRREGLDLARREAAAFLMRSDDPAERRMGAAWLLRRRRAG